MKNKDYAIIGALAGIFGIICAMFYKEHKERVALEKRQKLKEKASANITRTSARKTIKYPYTAEELYGDREYFIPIIKENQCKDKTADFRDKRADLESKLTELEQERAEYLSRKNKLNIEIKPE